MRRRPVFTSGQDQLAAVFGPEGARDIIAAAACDAARDAAMPAGRDDAGMPIAPADGSWSEEMMSDVACLCVFALDAADANESEEVVEYLKVIHGRKGLAAALVQIRVDVDQLVASALGVTKYGNPNGIFAAHEHLAGKIAGFCTDVGVPGSGDDAENCWKPFRYELYNAYKAHGDRAELIAKYREMAKEAWVDSDGEWDDGDLEIFSE
jgi:hypothetical protein